jgi:DNA topoisomerase-2
VESFLVRGCFREMSRNEDGVTLEITEIPFDKCLSDYKDSLTAMVAAEKIDHVKDLMTDDQVNYVVRLTLKQYEAAEKKGGLFKYLKLESSISMKNLVAYNARGKIVRYNSIQNLLDEWIDFRLPFYGLRKETMLRMKQLHLSRLQQRIRFILMVVEEKIKVRNEPKVKLIQQLKLLKFPLITKFNVSNPDDDEEEEEKEITSTNVLKAVDMENWEDMEKGYDYLVGMPLWSLTMERVQQMRDEIKVKEDEITSLTNTTIETLWVQDIDNLLQGIDKFEAAERQKILESSKRFSNSQTPNSQTKNATKKPQASNKKKTSDSNNNNSISKRRKTKPTPS